MVTTTNPSAYALGDCMTAYPSDTARIPNPSSLNVDTHAGNLHLSLHMPHIQASATQNRLRASSTSSLRHPSSSSWSGCPARINEDGQAGPAGWGGLPPQPLPSPGLPIEEVVQGGREADGDQRERHISGSRASRTHAFFGTSHASDIPLPPKPLAHKRENSLTSSSSLEPLTANPTGPGGFRENGRNRQRSRESLREGEGSWSSASGAKLPSEVASERAIQSLNRARSLNDRPPTRSNTFFSQIYSVTPPSNSLDVPIRGAPANTPPLPGFVCLGLGSSPGRNVDANQSSRAVTSPAGLDLSHKPSLSAVSLPISPVESIGTSHVARPSSALSPPSKLTREASNVGKSRDGSFHKGQVLKGEDDVAKDTGISTGYRLEMPLGEGAFSVVWSAREVEAQRGANDQGGRLVAIKLMDKRLCEKNDRTRISFLREVAVLKHISHPHIVSYISSFSTPDYHCLVLENLGGGELFDLIQRPGNRRRMGESFLSRVFGELCRGVGWLHEAAVVHRDLKLENILFTVNPFSSEYAAADGFIATDRLPSPLIKLTDFGLSRFIDPDHPLLRTRCGSESFAAPEIIMGQPYDGRDTDSWAVGVILFALVAGELPFDDVPLHGGMMEGDSDRRKRMMRIARGHYQWPSSANVPAAVKEVVSKLVERDPRKRVRVGPALWDFAWLKHSGVSRPGTTNMEEMAASTVEGITTVLDGFIIHQAQQVEAIAHAEMEK